jgi:hypothetical protein
MSQYKDEDLRAIGLAYAVAVAQERGADAAELVRSIATCVRATEHVDARGLNDALNDALRSRRLPHRDSPEMLVRDMLGYLKVTRKDDEDVEHFFKRAQELFGT